MKIIIAPTDFSKNGNNAAEYAATMAKEFESKLILVYVYETFKNTETGEAEKELKIEAMEKLTLLSGRLSKQYGIQTEIKLLSGETPAGTIIKFANEILADIIIAGSTGTNLLERMLMGSTSSRLVYDSKCAVLCIPPDVIFEPVKRIAFATDLKEDNINAALSLTTFAQHFDAEICFLYVDDKDLIHDDNSVTEMTSRIKTRVRYPRLSGYVTKHTDIQKGIKNFLKQQPVQVLAMFTHADESSSLRFSESVTADMSDHTKIPLLALKKGIVTVA